MDSDDDKPETRTQHERSSFNKDKKELDAHKSKDAAKRYAYLLGQTDIFSHFLNMQKERGVDVSDYQALSPSSKKKAVMESDHRHRKTEVEEDTELMNVEGDEEEVLFTESPSYVKGGSMRDYQIQGLNWLISLYQNGINGILADEMGLGKTLQTISFLGYLKHFKNITGPHIVIVPKSTLHNWVQEFKKWCPSIKVFMFHGMKEERQQLIKDTLLTSDFEVCVTSFEMCLLEKQHLKKFSWKYIVIDEAHRIKNENSALSQIVRLFNCRNRLLLTGTPLQNNLHELWALLNFLLPDVFGSSEDFDSWFALQGGDQDAVVKQLHKILRPFLLRRIKAEVEKSLLPKQKVNLYVGMSTMQRKWYQKLLEKDIDAVNGVEKGKTRLLNIVMQLRKCCNHPYLFDGAEPGPPYENGPHLVDNAGKMAVLDKLLPHLQAQGSRVLLFSQMSRMLDIMEDYCFLKGYEYCRIDGSTPHEDRVTSIDEYNSPGSKKFLFLLTTRAGGLGINLATADIVIMYDNDWNPQVDLQAEDRAHRIGQKKQVKIYRFITEDSVEEKVIDRATQKLRLDQLVIQQGRAATTNKAASKDELVSMIRHGAESIFQSAESTIASDSIEDIIQRSIVKTKDLEGKYTDMKLDDLQNFSMNGSVYTWEGEDFKGKRKAEDIGSNWIQPAKRERKANYSVDTYYRDALNLGGPRGPIVRAPKPKQFLAYDHMFFPPRLLEFQNRETLAYRREMGYKIPITFKKKGDKEEDPVSKQQRLKEQAKIDTALPLNDEELAEKEEMLQHGFDNWARRDYFAFIRGNEKYGRNNFEAIATEIEGKTVEEVKEYAKVFWERYTELADYQKTIAKIEEGESKAKRIFDTQQVLSSRIASLHAPLQQLKINYGQIKGKHFTEDEDRFLLVMLNKYGYGNDDAYEKIRQEIKRSSMFRFDWFIKSRTALELNRRCATLILCLMKEHESEEGASQRRSNVKQRVATTGTRKGKPVKK